MRKLIKKRFFASDYKYVNYAEVPEIAVSIPVSDPNGLAILPKSLTKNRLVLICHGSGATQSSGGDTSGLQRMLLNQGWYVARHLAFSSTNWGNPASVSSYSDMIDHMKATYNISTVMILAGSMGNMAAAQLVKNRSDITHWFGMEPALNLANMYSGSFSSAINTAYGITGVSPNTYAEKTANSDPCRYAANTYKNKAKIYLLSSPADTVVPTANNAQVFYERYNTDGTVMTWDNTATGDHGDATHYDQTKILNFFLS